MESVEDLKTEKVRITEFDNIGVLKDWLTAACGFSSFLLHRMPGDASFRRYFRVITSTHSFVLMDARAEKESCHAYIAIANALRSIGVITPDIIEADKDRGLLLLTDFGDLTYLNALTEANSDLLYGEALNTLALLQACRDIDHYTIPLFTRELMMQEWQQHQEWFLHKLLKLTLPAAETQLDKCYQLLVESAVTQPQVFMHRDYHSANLMVLPKNKAGILDFQDAFMGPVTYDLVSLLRDCYIDWPEKQVKAWVLQYLEKLNNLGVLSSINQQDFLRWFDYMGMQRHLKTLLTFGRKNVRDGKASYLAFVSRTLKYLITVSKRYPELLVLHNYLSMTVQPAFARVYQCAP